MRRPGLSRDDDLETSGCGCQAVVVGPELVAAMELRSGEVQRLRRPDAVVSTKLGGSHIVLGLERQEPEMLERAQVMIVKSLVLLAQRSDEAFEGHQWADRRH